MPTNRPLKVFLCHASADKPAVRKLYQYLRERKMDPWLDTEKLLPGQNWQVEIPKALLSSDVIIICLSKNSVDKEGYVQKEIKFALDKALEMPERRIFLIPARLEECDLPSNLSTYQAVNLFEADGYKRLLRSLRVRAEQIGAAKISVNQDTIPPTNNRLYSVNSQAENTIDVERKIFNKELIPENRILEAAIEKQVNVGTPTSLFVWVKRLESKSIISVVSSIDEDVVLDEDNVKSKGLEIEFPIENGQILPVGIILRLVAHEFTPPIQQKRIIVPPEGDSEVCTFIISPNKAGKLLLNLEVLKDQISIATRTLHTTAIESEKNKLSSMVLVSIPIIVVVQPQSTRSAINGINIGGDVSSANIIVGDNNVIQVVPKQESESKIDSSNQEAGKASREKSEHETFEVTNEKSEHEVLQKKSAQEFIQQNSAQATMADKHTEQKQPTHKSIPNWLGVLGFVVIIAIILTVIITMNQNPPAPAPTATTSFTVSSIPSETLTSLPTKTITPSPLPTKALTPESTNVQSQTLGIGSSTISPKDGMKLLYVPAGNFLMGSKDSDPNALADEKPQHTIYLNAFLIDQTEVTNKMYSTCVKMGGCQPPGNSISFSHSDYYQYFTNRPAVVPFVALSELLIFDQHIWRLS